MNVALLTKYDDLAASTRFRFSQYKPYLKEKGIEMVFQPLFSNNYLQNLYKNGYRRQDQIISSYYNRLKWLISKPDVDLIWLHYELFPFLPSIFERLIKLPKKPIVFDYDDAIFHNYDFNSNWFIKMLLEKKLQTTISSAKISFCGNNYLAEYASRYCSKIEIVPTLVDTKIFYPKITQRPKNDFLRIGWIGTPSTWNNYVAPILPMLKEITKKEKIEIAVMGADKKAKADSSINFTEWKKEEEVSFLHSLDIGIMPLTNTPWAKGKCGFKLIQYMACGLPVLASPVGVNSDIVEHGVNGFLVETVEDWKSAIKKLCNEPELRYQMGTAGRKKIEEKYSLEIWGPHVANILSNIT